MEYRYLGNSGLQISVISLGNWLGSDKPDSKEKNYEIVKKAYELGINFFDTAEGYGKGQAEIQLGYAIKKLNIPRSKLVVSTKIYYGTKSNDEILKFPNFYKLSRKHILEGTYKSLKRLELDYVDIIFAHRHDIETPIEEICRAFNFLIKKRKTFYWGTSMWSAEQIAEAYEVCERLNLIPPIAEQPEYNLLQRNRMEVEYLRLFKKFKMGSTVWSPLAGGILTGKYIDIIPNDSRIISNPELLMFYGKKYFDNGIKENIDEKLKKLKSFCEKINIPLATMMLVWVISYKYVSSAIIGVSNIGQLEQNVNAVKIYKELNPQILQEFQQLMDNNPEPDQDHVQDKPIIARK